MSALRPVVRGHLERGEFAALLALAGRERGVARALVSLLYDGEELLRWRAVSMIGRLAAAHPEQARPLVTRLLWTLNDESGGNGWSSAPALGEIGRNAPELLRGCVRVVVHYLEDPTLVTGVLWAIGRLAPAFPGETREVAPQLAALLGSADASVRAHAAWALGEIGDPRTRPALAERAGDAAPARIYVGEVLVTKEVRDWAGEAAGRLAAA